MRISTAIKENKIRVMFIVIAMVVALCVSPMTLKAYNIYDVYTIEELIEMMRTDNNFMVLFEPSPGHFTMETHQGIRFVLAGQPLSREEFPYPPIREGYIFDGWSNNGVRVEGDYLEVPNFLTLSAIWVRDDEGATQTPSTTPAPSPTPAPPATTPVPGATPTPTPSPSPTPTTGSQGPQGQNPITSPITISFMIFGAVVALGITALTIVNLSMRHTVAVGKYRKNAMRYKRESRITSILGVGNKKISKPTKDLDK